MQSAQTRADIALGDNRTEVVSGAAEKQLVAHSLLLLPIDAAGILVCGSRGELHVSEASGKDAALLERIQLDSGSGPSLEACWSGEPVVVEDLRVAPQRWPAFADRAVRHHYLSTFSFPLRLGEDRIGSLNLFRTEPRPMSNFDSAIGRALADVAAIGMVHERKLSDAELVKQQLQTALHTRVIIEQAKGVMAERGGMDVNQAFTLMRSYARRSRQRLSDVARAVVEGSDTSAIISSRSSGRRIVERRHRVSASG